MTRQEIINGMDKIRYTFYSTGVLHTSTPQWIIDLRWCLRVIEFLLKSDTPEKNVDKIIKWIEDKHGEHGELVLAHNPNLKQEWIELLKGNNNATTHPK